MAVKLDNDGAELARMGIFAQYPTVHAIPNRPHTPRPLPWELS